MVGQVILPLSIMPLPRFKIPSCRLPPGRRQVTRTPRGQPEAEHWAYALHTQVNDVLSIWVREN